MSTSCQCAFESEIRPSQTRDTANFGCGTLAKHSVHSAMEQERHAVSSVARPPAPGHIGAMPEPVILVDNLVKRYGTTLAVDGISFAVGRGHRPYMARRRRAGY